MGDGWVDAQEGLVESGSQMGQGNCRACRGVRGRGAERDSSSQRTDSHSGQCRLVSAQDTVPGCRPSVTVALGSSV